MNLYQRKADEDTCVGYSLHENTHNVRHNLLLRQGTASNEAKVDRATEKAVTLLNLKDLT